MTYRPRHQALSLLFAVSIALGSQNAAAFSLLEWLGFGKDEAQTESAPESAGTGKSANWAESSTQAVAEAEPAPAVQAAQAGVRFEDIRIIISNLNAEQRSSLLSDEAAFNNFIQQRAANASVLAAARANNLDQDPLTELLMRNSADSTLREIYIKRLINKELPADFPSEEQARTFYDNNQARFTLEERIHLWQIFLPFDKPADTKAEEAVKQQAQDLKKKIDAGKLEFATAAAEYSRHIPSRHAGGYMGLIKLSDIKPEISESVLGLKAGQLSAPIRTDEGYHLIIPGNRVGATVMPFEEVRARINQALRDEAEKRLRRAIFDQAGKTYQQAPDAKRIEEWRLKLRTNL